MMAPATRYLTAAEAAARLGVHRSTLYAYVSRGQVRAEPDPRSPHASRYLVADVERLRDRKEARLRPGEAARKTLHFGLPVLQSGITLIADGRVFYRGQDAIALARSSTFEHAIDVLWRTRLAKAGAARIALPRALRPLLRPLAPADRLQPVLAFMAAGQAALQGRPTKRSVARDFSLASGLAVVHAMVAAATLRDLRGRTSIAHHLARAWGAPHPKAAALIDAALVSCADHELNVSAFAVRVAASAGSSLPDAVLAGVCALRGSRHGGQTDLVEMLLDEAASPRRLRAAIARRGDKVPGFGHPLYPDGDPRGRLLCDLVIETAPASEPAAWVHALRASGAELLGEHPTIDVGLVLLRRALGLPRGAAFLLFAIGRSAGWIAHAMEQHQSPQIIRPRAAYGESA